MRKEKRQAVSGGAVWNLCSLEWSVNREEIKSWFAVSFLLFLLVRVFHTRCEILQTPRLRHLRAAVEGANPLSAAGHLTEPRSG